MSARNFNVEHLPRKHVRSRTAPADYSGARAVNARVGALRAAKPEFHNRIALCRVANFSGFCCDKRLVIEHVQNSRFYKLRLHDRSANG